MAILDLSKYIATCLNARQAKNDTVSLLFLSFYGFILICFFLKKIIGIQLIYSVVLVSGMQHSESVLRVFVLFSFFKDSFPIQAITKYSRVTYTICCFIIFWCFLKFSCLYHCFCMKQSQLTMVICFPHIDQILLLIVNSNFSQ